MKRIVFLLVVLALFGVGCAATQTTNPVSTVVNWFCKPTPEQTQAAQVGETLAQAALTELATLSGNLAAQALSTVAIPTFKLVIDGVCATQANWNAAVNAIKQASADPAMAAKMSKAVVPPVTLADQLTYLASIKWPVSKNE